MAAVPYPPWGSAPSTLDGQDKTEKWWKNAKDALKKPWKWKKHKGKSSPPACTPSTQLDARIPFGGFPPIMSQLSSLYERRMSDPEERTSRRLYERGTEDTTDFEPPEYKPPRPLLSNVFSMYDTPSVIAGKPGGGGAVRREGDGGWRKEEGGERGGRRRQVPSTTASKQRHDNVKLEEEENEEEDKEGETGRERRHTPSAESVGSNDRSMERRQRRTGAVRDLPRLPKRSASFDYSDVKSQCSLPEAAMRRRRRPTPAPRDIVDGIPPRHFVHSPLEGITHHNFQILPWQLHPDCLPPLSEEGDASADEIKGFDSFMMY